MGAFRSLRDAKRHAGKVVGRTNAYSGVNSGACRFAIKTLWVSLNQMKVLQGH
jgi:hypothetical protein